MNRKIFVIFFIIMISKSAFCQYSDEIDSLINLSKNLEDVPEKVDLYNTVCWKIKYIDFESSLFYGEKALEISKKIDYKDGTALAYKNLGGINYITQNYSNAATFYDSSLTYYSLLNDSSGISKITKNLGSVMHQQGNYDKAIEYYLKSLDIRKSLGEETAIADVYNNLGVVYSEQGEAMFEQAKENFFNALKVFESINDTVGIAESYSRIGALYLNLKNELKDSANYYYDKLLEYSLYLEDDFLAAQAYEGLGLISYKNNDNENAKNYYLEAEKIWIEMDNKFSLASIYSNLGEMYFVDGNYSKSLEYTKKANDLAVENNMPALVLQTSSLLMKIYKELGNSEVALDYAIISISLKDSLQGEEMREAITRMEVKHEYEKQMQAQEQMQKMLNIEHEAQLKRQRIISIFSLLALALMIGVAVLILRSYRQKKKANQLLEDKNREISYKNEMLHQQNEEIEAQRDEIEKQRDKVIAQKNEIEKQKQHITDSIIYAQRIQAALLPPEEFISSMLKEYFVLFMPRDIVSGDFYWAAEKENLAIITAADCTGHGVPGAFMSMLGVAFLNEIVNKYKTEKIDAGFILTELRNHVKKSLRQTGKENEAKDGMDISLCVIDKSKKIIHYAGAHNPLVQISDGELINHAADRMPIGIHIKEKPQFKNNIIEYKENDQFYLFSDGIVDQFGGMEGKKFMSKNFKNSLLDFHQLPLIEQKEKIRENFIQWTSSPDLPKKYDQIDDICVIGFKM